MRALLDTYVARLGKLPRAEPLERDFLTIMDAAG